MVVDLFLIKTPDNIQIENIKKHILKIDGIIDVHHIHIWSLDGYNNYATMHIVSDKDSIKIKNKVREALKGQGILHTTIELEDGNEKCNMHVCNVDNEHLNKKHHQNVIFSMEL